MCGARLDLLTVLIRAGSNPPWIMIVDTDGLRVQTRNQSVSV